MQNCQKQEAVQVYSSVTLLTPVERVLILICVNEIRLRPASYLSGTG